MELKLVTDYVFDKVENFCKKLNGKVKRNKESIECILPERKELMIVSSLDFIALTPIRQAYSEIIDTEDIDFYLKAYNSDETSCGKLENRLRNYIQGSFEKIKVTYDSDNKAFKFEFQ